MKLHHILSVWATVLCAVVADNKGPSPQPLSKTCVVTPSGNASIDDAPAIVDAFSKCGHNGRVVFLNETYYVNSVMNTTGLRNCDIDLKGTLLVSF
jgi:galacturan 1,4-alpha-galacturonidase